MAEPLRNFDPRQRWRSVGSAVFVLIVALAGAFVSCRRPPGEAGVVRFTIPQPEGATLVVAEPPVVSPDGRRLAFVAKDSLGKTRIWVRPLDTLLAYPLPGTEDASYPFWSPDSRFIGFFAHGKLKKIALSGEAQAPETLCNAPAGRGGTWSPQEVIVFAPRLGNSLYRVSSAGGVPTPVTLLDESRDEASHRWPFFLPDGRHFLYFVVSGQPETRGVYIGSVDSDRSRSILSANSSAAYSRPGYLLFVRAGVLMAQPFDAKRRWLAGDPVPVAEDVGNSAFLRGGFSASQTGVLIFKSGNDATELVWLDRSGQELRSVGPPGNYSHLSLSPDDRTVAVAGIDPQTVTDDISIIELSSGDASRFTVHPANDWFPTWSPDDGHIVFASNRHGPFDLFIKAANGTAPVEPLLQSAENKWPIDWSRDGMFIVYATRSMKGDFDLWVLPVFGNGAPTPFLETRFDERHSQFSPDGRWIAYVSNESGRDEVYVRPFPRSRGKWQLSTSGGYWPTWRRDGEELYYIAADGTLMAVKVERAPPRLEAGPARALFGTSWDAASLLVIKPYAVTSDGQRFLITRPLQTDSSTAFTVVLNWTAVLNR